MKNPLGEKKTFLLMAGILSFLAYLWGFLTVHSFFDQI